ncbi:zinc finger protein [Trypanosoma melophagium]|uniref:zinc finger protein n=1 Tax=Trypanosoma melophagium TaxID=715481 RepID=UPI003519DC1E|nr:zinc finger protein [Trypanosoma melophagium]
MFGGVPRLRGHLAALAGPAVFRRLTTAAPAGEVSASFSSASFSSSALLWGRRGCGGPTRVLLGRRIKGRRSRHREPAEGDWLCQCGELNYKSKRECFKCGAPAPPLPPGVRRPSLPGEDPHDWACPCGQMNFRGSVVCHKCQQPKPAPPPLPGKEVTLWTCPKCKGVNRNVRKFCFKCSAPSPLLTFKPVV